jgi:hypothetical protein
MEISSRAGECSWVLISTLIRSVVPSAGVGYGARELHAVTNASGITGQAPHPC